MRRGATCVSAKLSTRSIHSSGESGPGPDHDAGVVVGHHAELVDRPAKTIPVLRPGAVPAAGLLKLGVDVDGDDRASQSGGRASSSTKAENSSRRDPLTASQSTSTPATS